MPTIAEQMEAALGQKRILRPSDLLKAAADPAKPTRPLEQLTPAQDPADLPRIVVIGGVSPCPRCKGTWILDDMRPNGSTRCYTCKTTRIDPLTIPDEGPALPIPFANQANGSSSSAKTLEEFINAVTKAGYPHLAELAIKYQPKTIEAKGKE